jgi:hypothetical protein
LVNLCEDRNTKLHEKINTRKGVLLLLLPFFFATGDLSVSLLKSEM